MTTACPACGTMNLAGAKFCGKCGRQLATGADTSATYCPRCGAANNPMARFCGTCGQTFDSLTSAAMPARSTPYAQATQAQVHAVTPHKTARRTPWALLFGVIGASMAVLAVVAKLVMVQGAATCTVSCPQPPPPAPPAPLLPAGPPLRSPAEFTSSALGFTLDYPQGVQPAAQDAQSVTWEGQLTSDGSTFYIKFQGAAANNQTPQQLVQALQQSALNGATVVFPIGGSELGYVGGYGNIYDATLSPQGGQQLHVRAIIEAAVRNGVAIEAVTISQYKADANEHPSPASLEPAIEQFADLVGNTVTWQGEQPL